MKPWCGWLGPPLPPPASSAAPLRFPPLHASPQRAPAGPPPPARAPAVARRLWGVAEAVAAAAILAFAFLPVAYSRYAVTDAGVLLPAALAVYGAVRIRDDGRLRSYLVDGAGTGLAIGFKYTAGLVLLIV